MLSPRAGARFLIPYLLPVDEARFYCWLAWTEYRTGRGCKGKIAYDIGITPRARQTWDDNYAGRERPTVALNPYRITWEELERLLLAAAMHQTGNHRGNACARLKISRRSLQDRLARHGLQESDQVEVFLHEHFSQQFKQPA